jgi:hypothetical protein
VTDALTVWQQSTLVAKLIATSVAAEQVLFPACDKLGVFFSLEAFYVAYVWNAGVEPLPASSSLAKPATGPLPSPHKSGLIYSEGKKNFSSVMQVLIWILVHKFKLEWLANIVTNKASSYKSVERGKGREKGVTGLVGVLGGYREY